jgi:hypothetical protein
MAARNCPNDAAAAAKIAGVGRLFGSGKQIVAMAMISARKSRMVILSIRLS